jgi:hypothetical protein
LRDPIDIAISQVNYILTRLKQDAMAGELLVDTREWLPYLDIDKVPDEPTDEMLRGLGQHALRKREIVPPNPMCSWLAGGDAATVIARLAEHDVEVTNTRQYENWRRQRWSVDANTRQNESIKFLTRESIGADDLGYLHEISVEDTKLYRAVDGLLLQTGALAVTDWSAAPVEEVASAA